MKLLKEILAKILAVWAILVFIVSMLLIIIPSWLVGIIPEPRRTTVFIDISRVWMKIFFVLTGVRRVFKGKKNFKKGENYIVVCNHRSFMDVPLTSPGIPGPNKTIAKIDMMKIPVFSLIYKRGSVLVDRKSEASRKASYGKMKDVLAMGMHMCIYPEGTRNKTREPLQRFQDGAFRLAIDTKKAVMPAVVFYTAKILPVHKGFYFWPHRVEMHFLEPVQVQPGDTTESIKTRVFELMKDYYVAHNR
jgi:1-acyl-sn-glycerol-3-phosphate acyltransferase